MINIVKKVALVCVLTIAFEMQVFSQKTDIYDSPDVNYRMAIELFQKEKFGAAKDQFLFVYENADENSPLTGDSYYYASRCAMELFHKDAGAMMIDFINSYPENSYIKIARYEIGRYYFRTKSWSKTINALAAVDVVELNKEQKTSYHFMLGYSLFQKKKYKQAKPEFFQIIDEDSQYKIPANYYYAHLSYMDKNYETALISFNRILDNETFAPLAPYYIVQIYYFQKKYDKILETAPALLAKATEKRKPEIAKLIGEAYYMQESYSQAVPYLLQYLDSRNKNIVREDYYQLAMCYYRSKQFENAVEYFSKVVTPEDSLAQNAYFHIADCFIKQDDKRYAATAFMKAYNIENNETLREEALYNYAKITYESSYNPWNQAITAFELFLDSYPNSTHKQEVYEYLVNLFISTKNYKGALESLDKISNKSPNMKEAYQHISYMRAVELFNNGELREAVKYFEQSRTYNYNKKLSALSLYWEGEAYFQLKDDANALLYYDRFQQYQGASKYNEFDLCTYNIAYAKYNAQEYETALISFRKFIRQYKGGTKVLISDSELRTADCYYVSRDYKEAIRYYDKVIDNNIKDMDYALFQKAICQGLNNDFDSKINTLKVLESMQMQSRLLDDALYHIAESYQNTGNPVASIEYYNKIIENHPKSTYLQSSLLQSSNVLRQQKRHDEALVNLKKIMTDYPGTAQSKQALDIMKSVYEDLDQLDVFFNYVGALPYANITLNEQDSIVFEAAINKYRTSNWSAASSAFGKYIKDYSQGLSIYKARYYKARCDIELGNDNDALSNINWLLSKPITQYTESVLQSAIKLNTKQNNTDDLLANYFMLEHMAVDNENILKARTGIMRIFKEKKDWTNSIIAADTLLNTEGVEDEIVLVQEAHLCKATAARNMDSISLAKVEYIIASRDQKNEIAVEARYYLAYFTYQEEKYMECEDMVFNLINEIPSYDYWIAKNFLLLAECYIAREDYINAKFTLQNIVDNYSGADLLQQAVRRLDEVEEIEIQKQKEEAQQSSPSSNNVNTNIFDE